jgi:hypothetical protein
MPAPTITDTNNFNSAIIHTFRAPAGASVGASSNSVNNANNTSLAATAPASAIANELMAIIVGGYSGGANLVSLVNGALTALTEHRDSLYAIGSDYQMSSLTTGIKAAAGATGNSTVTTTANAVLASVTVGIRAT